MVSIPIERRTTSLSTVSTTTPRIGPKNVVVPPTIAQMST
jgi:hypothetical protein